MINFPVVTATVVVTGRHLQHRYICTVILENAIAKKTVCKKIAKYRESNFTFSLFYSSTYHSVLVFAAIDHHHVFFTRL